MAQIGLMRRLPAPHPPGLPVYVARLWPALLSTSWLINASGLRDPPIFHGDLHCAAANFSARQCATKFWPPVDRVS
jgi:hypothetical protein